jgi:hypothetical protein
MPTALCPPAATASASVVVTSAPAVTTSS